MKFNSGYRSELIIFDPHLKRTLPNAGLSFETKSVPDLRTTQVEKVLYPVATPREKQFFKLLKVARLSEPRNRQVSADHLAWRVNRFGDVFWFATPRTPPLWQRGFFLVN